MSPVFRERLGPPAEREDFFPRKKPDFFALCLLDADGWSRHLDASEYQALMMRKLLLLLRSSTAGPSSWLPTLILKTIHVVASSTTTAMSSGFTRIYLCGKSGRECRESLLYSVNLNQTPQPVVDCRLSIRWAPARGGGFCSWEFIRNMYSVWYRGVGTEMDWIIQVWADRVAHPPPPEISSYHPSPAIT